MSIERRWDAGRRESAWLAPAYLTPLDAVPPQNSASRLALFAKGVSVLEGAEDAEELGVVVGRHVLRAAAPETVDLLLRYEVGYVWRRPSAFVLVLPSDVSWCHRGFWPVGAAS